MNRPIATPKAAFGRGQNRPRRTVKPVYVAANDPLPVVDKWPRGVRLAILVGGGLIGWSLIIAAIVIPGALLPVASLFLISLAAMMFALARQRRG